VVSARPRQLGVLLLLGAACTTQLSSELEGLECKGAERRCLPGYECNADNRCMRAGSLQQAGGSSGAGDEDASAVQQGGAGAGGAAGTPQLPAGGSTGTAQDAGTGGSPLPRYDAGRGLDALDASVLPEAGACPSPVPLYRDEDEDGYGVTAQQAPGCPPLEKWALQGGDCRDDLPDVHPEQTVFFPTGYPDPTRPSAGNLSFDYDCDFLEEPEPGSVAAPNCGQLLSCSGSGYVAASPARSGPGIDPICGSTGLNVCQSMTLPLLGLTCSAQAVGAAAARCQ
jgi:hypothetical protein